LFAKRDSLLEKLGLEGNAYVNETRDLLGFGAAINETGRGFYGFGYDYVEGGDSEEEEDDYDYTEVDFLRPDGDIETKDVQWCKDNNFFQVGDELWSGPWYYESKEQMIADKKESEECIKEFLAMGDDIKEKADYVFPSKKDSTNFHKTHVCQECNKHFQSFYLMHCHMRKCCPNMLARNISPNHFAVDTCSYECMLCYQEYPDEDECLRHFNCCPTYWKFCALSPDTFIKPKPRRRFPCAGCGREHAKWNKCLEHMSICCPSVLLAGKDEELNNVDAHFSSLTLNADAAEFKPASSR
jgi:hypothetical protein